MESVFCLFLTIVALDDSLIGHSGALGFSPLSRLGLVGFGVWSTPFPDDGVFQGAVVRSSSDWCH